MDFSRKFMGRKMQCTIRRTSRVELCSVRYRRARLQRMMHQIMALRRCWLFECMVLESCLSNHFRAQVSSHAQLKMTSNAIKKMEQMNTLNDCFYIWYSKMCATINGFRLGRIAKDQVTWHEINAALGQVLLFLSSINFVSTRFVVITSCG